MVITKQKSIVDSQKIKKRESKHTPTENHQFTKQQQQKKKSRDLQNSQKTINKISLISPYLSIITLNVNGDSSNN